MPSVLEILNKTTAYFTARGLEKPKLDAEHLLAQGMSCKRLDLYLRFDEILPEGVLVHLRELVKRRGNREPLQIILGEVPFLDLKLKVRAQVLIPRPETEDLVDRLQQLWKDNPPERLLDLGTGSGAIALALAKAFPKAQVVAVDKSQEALALAQENARYNGLEGRVEFLESDWFSAVKGQFDWIIANPPYLTEEEWVSAEPEVKNFEPRGALVSGFDGLEDLRFILKQARAYLSTDAVSGLALETGIAQHEVLAKLAEEAGFSAWESWQDIHQRKRFFIARR